jgi:cation diffusion facilitator CzcD-associated flavoprotein CzcO
VEHFDVLIVGAGLSGIGAAHYVETATPWADYAIFEARDAIGGTWDLFRYPGIRSDSDMFTLGYSLRPWDGDESIADGASILQYIKDTATEAGVDKHIRFNHRIVRADWSTPDACWRITAERTDTGEDVSVTCSFLFTCCGYYRYDHGYLPDFPGTDNFDGTIVHPQQWPEDFDGAGQRIVVIGSGATAVTLLPSLAREADHVTMLQRSPSYIAAFPAKNLLTPFLRWLLPDQRAGRAIRWVNAVGTQLFFQVSRRFPALVKRGLIAAAKLQLPKGFDVKKHFTPRYEPWDQRLCVAPDGDLFRAVKSGKASVVTDHIETFTATGLRLRSGAELEADIVIAATGLELLFMGGMELTVDGELVDLASKVTYKGMMLEGVPNCAIAVGYTNASWTLKADLTFQYVCRLLDHMRASGMRQCTPVNHDDGFSPEPLLGLSSGYVQRAVDKFPRQGEHDPWRVNQSYLRDYRLLKRSPLEDGSMAFTNPTNSSC